MKKIYLLFFSISIYTLLCSQTPVPMASQPGLSYTENFSDIANWTNGFASGIGANRFGSVPVNATGTIPDGVRITTSTATFVTGTSGGVQKGSSQTVPIESIVLLSTGATDNTSSDAIDFFMDFTGVDAGTLSFDWVSINNSTGDRKGSLRVYYSTNGTTYTEIPSAQVLNFTNNSPTSGSVTAIALPAAFNNSATARLRFYYYNGTGGTAGSRPKISFDNLTVTANAGAPATTVSVSAGNNASEPASDGTFIINLSSAAPAGGVTVNYNFSGPPTGTAVLNTDYSDPQNGSVTINEGGTSAIVTLNVLDDIIPEPTETIIITLSSATNGFTIATSNATINLLDNDIEPIYLSAGIYSQDFDSLANSGSSTILPKGWIFSESGASANTSYSAGNGTSNTGDTYSFGAISATDRAFGGLQSGNLIPTIGAYILNNTGNAINSLNITFTGEQWRLGATGRNDIMDFQYSLNATSLTSGSWIDVDQLDFTAPNSTGTVGALDGNLPANKILITYTITGLSIPNGAIFFIRWNDFNATSSDDGLGIDDFTMEANPVDLTPPTISSLSPSNNATNISTNVAAGITFTESIQKGIGNIVVKRTLDNSILETIDVTSSRITVSGNTATFNLSGLASNTGYYIEIDNGAFKDLANNNFSGISGSSTWSFTTGTIFYNASFNNCSSSPSEGFTTYSVTGPQVWACTTFGRDAGNPPSGSAPNGVQINGFNVTNIPNEDWLISPSFDLSATNYPLLSYWSRTRFNGAPLQLKVSTDYTSGDPTLATWTDLNGKFPAPTSDVWTLSENINLSFYKTANVHFAFVYYSTDDEGARWTLDDIQLNNSATPPPASLTISTSDMQFGYVAAGGSIVRTFSFTGNDITGDVTINITSGFLLSKDNSTFSSTLIYSQPEANNNSKTVYVKFAPSQNDRNYNGVVTISTPGVSDTVINLKGTSIDPVKTLEVVNWNVEWFGSTANGPVDNNQQEQNIKTILQNIGADIYGLVEVVDEARLANVVSQMPGYGYVISNFGSHTNTNEAGASPLSEAQKLAFVYKTSVFTNVTTTPLLSQGINSSVDLSNPAYNYYASGRFPYMMSSDVTLDGITRNMKFILIHAKANTSPTLISYDRRKKGADSLHYTLSTLYPSDNIVLLGDFNDDLDSTITDGINPRITSYISFTNDSANYPAVTLPLSRARKKSTVSYNEVIDHVVVSDEMSGYFMNSSANILTDVTSLVTNYASTTSDHYPVFTRFAFDLTILPVSLVNFSAIKVLNSVKLYWTTAQEINSRNFVVEKSVDGIHFENIGSITAAGNSSTVHQYELVDGKPVNGINYYRLKSIDNDNKFTYSKVITITFTKNILIKLFPNPARELVQVWYEGTLNTQATIRLSDMNGRIVWEQSKTLAPLHVLKLNIKGLSRGVYILEVEAQNILKAEKLIIH
jgi:Big-like domain-containing protein/type IX secretion system substrate protein/endonuclease/exonuclease/phosphatase family protein